MGHSLSQKVIIMDVKIGSMNVSIWSILLIIGGLLAFIGMFLDYVVMTIDLGFLGSESEGFTGLDLLDTDEDEYGALSFVSKFPLVIGIVGILALLSGVLPMFVKGQDKVFTIAGAVFAVVAVVLAIWFFVQGVGPGLFVDEPMQELFGDTLSAGVGLYLALVGSIVAAVGGILNLKEAL